MSISDKRARGHYGPVYGGGLWLCSFVNVKMDALDAGAAFPLADESGRGLK